MAIEKILVPDIGGSEADVIEILVKSGDQVQLEDALITMEGEKATMDVPAPVAGKIKSIDVKVGDKLAEGQLIATIETAAAEAAKEKSKETPKEAPKKSAEEAPKVEQQKNMSNSTEETFAFGTDVHAGPAVRRIAQEFGVNLRKISPTGPKQRITKEDVQKFVKQQLSVAENGGGSGFNFPPLPKTDFAKYGDIESQALSKIKKISGANLHRNWVGIPHVTQFDEADITEMEAFRKEQKSIAAAQGIKLTPLVFIMKAVVATLKQFPSFNASLDASGENLIVKKYFHIGVAVDTPNGLVVPVIRDVDKKGIYALAEELGAISKKAREKGLSMAEMQGGCFTISSLGGIGGTAFTPIINAPEVAILGVSRSATKPIYLKSENKFVPRLMLPLCLSYDHRVIDGADGARFITFLSSRLSDMRTILL
ncbi:MAG: dihydrolipoyllysine-residue acetyltransferase [Gammaproteobacteria bacterium]|nr:dihydrolipoyllysine-residue acetyltransferase [Gammaproteobacteria bacterium]